MVSNGTNVGRPWTPAEDKFLRDAVSIHGDDTEKWKTIALSVPGRTNKACRKRWLHSLCPTVKKTAWTQEEDTNLLALFARHPNKWSQIAREIPGRTDDACSKRYREALDPNLKKDEWTEEEDMRLLECYILHGGKWGAIGLALRRSGLGCRNRWRLLERKKNSTSRQPESSSQQGLNPASSSLWTSFGENPSADSYWNSALGNWSLNADTAFDAVDSQILNRGSHVGDFGTNELSSSALVTAIGPSSSTSQRAVMSFNFASSSLSSALTESDPSLQRNAESTTASSNAAVDEHDGGSENWDFGIDNDDPIDIFSEPSNPIEPASQPDATSTVQLPCTSLEEPIQHPSYVAEDLDAEEENRTSSEVHENTPADPSIEEASSTAAMPISTHYPDRSEQRPSKRQRTNRQYIVQVDSIHGRETQQPPKLSSTLAVASNPTLLAYACGSRECWQSGSARFSTSGELLNHYKAEHALEPCGSQDTPFRCGLRDCAKGWKSINGLQYHLQVSKAHFKRVLSNAALQKSQNSSQKSANAEYVSSSGPPVRKRKMHDCHFEDCPKSYKQLSGLRYHLQHGHPDTLPLQLDVVPPTIARRMGVEETAPSVPIPPAPS